MVSHIKRSLLKLQGIKGQKYERQRKCKRIKQPEVIRSALISLSLFPLFAASFTALSSFTCLSAMLQLFFSLSSSLLHLAHSKRAILFACFAFFLPLLLLSLSLPHLTPFSCSLIGIVLFTECVTMAADSYQGSIVHPIH